MAENEITVADRTGYLVNDLNRCRQAITYRGGTVSAKEGFMDIPDSIANIPLSSSIGTVTDDTLDSIKLIPSNSVPACYIKSIGGMTYKCENLMPFPYIASDIYNSNISLGVGDSYNFGSETLTVNADRSITISRAALETLTYPVSLSVTVPSADYYLTVFKISSEGDDNISISSNVGNIPYGESVFIPASTGITEIVLSASPEPYSCTLKIILSKYPYFEGLKDTKTTAVKVYGSNLIDFEAALKYWGMAYIKEGNSITTTVSLGNGYGKPYKFTDKPQICTISLAYASTTGYTNPRIDLVYIDETGAVTFKGSLALSGENISFTSSTEVNAIRLNYSSGKDETLSATFNELRINYGTADLGYKPYSVVTYEIPESLQGTGKGVEGAADTTDYENKKYITKCKTIALADVTGYSLESVGGSVNKYISDDGIAAVMSYAVNDFNHSLRTEALCSHLPTHTDWTGKTYGVVLQNMASGSHYIKVCIMAADAGITTDDIYATIVSKIITWLRDNNVILTYAIAEPTEESIDTSIFNNIPTVEAGGYLEFVTDNEFAPNSSVLFQTIP